MAYNFVDMRLTNAEIPESEDIKEIVVEEHHMEKSGENIHESSIYIHSITATGRFDASIYSTSEKFFLRRERLTHGWFYQIVMQKITWSVSGEYPLPGYETVIYPILAKTKKENSPEAVLKLHNKKIMEVVEIAGIRHQKKEQMCLFSLRSGKRIHVPWGCHLLKIFPVDNTYDNFIMRDSDGTVGIVWNNSLGESVKYPKKLFEGILRVHVGDRHVFLVGRYRHYLIRVNLMNRTFNLSRLDEFVLCSCFESHFGYMRDVLWSSRRGLDITALALIGTIEGSSLVKMKFNRCLIDAIFEIFVERPSEKIFMSYHSYLLNTLRKAYKQESLCLMLFDKGTLEVRRDSIDAPKKKTLSAQSLELIWSIGLVIAKYMPVEVSPGSSLVISIRDLVFKHLLNSYKSILRH